MSQKYLVLTNIYNIAIPIEQVPAGMRFIDRNFVDSDYEYRELELKNRRPEGVVIDESEILPATRKTDDEEIPF